MKIYKKILGFYQKINIYDKLIIFNSFTSFLAIFLPIAEYQLFDTTFFINNPLAVYLLMITFLMSISVFIKNTPFLIIKISSNIYYLIWVIIIEKTNQISQGPYELCPGYFINIIAPLLYIILTLFSLKKK